MATIPLETMGPTVNANGISIPTYADIRATLVYNYKAIYGSDVYLEEDSQDGQWLSVQASAINDSNMAAVAVYNQFSPATAVGAGLSSVVKINGIKRQSPSKSTVDVRLVGQAGTTITNGIVGDVLGQRWALPSAVTIPPGGEINATATAVEAGAIGAGIGTVINILTPTRGWQSVENLTAASPGQPVEVDAQLRVRQADSVALPALTPVEAIVGSVGSLPGVSQVRAYENDTNTTDADGLPAHSLAMVVVGGDSFDIAQVISDKKTIGAATFGNTTEMVPDPFGVPKAIKFSRPDPIAIEVQITLEALGGYTTATGVAIKAAVAAYINALKIGANVVNSRLYTPANLYGGVGSDAYEINTLTMNKTGSPPGTADIVIAFDEIAVTTPDDVVLTVV